MNQNLSIQNFLKNWLLPITLVLIIVLIVIPVTIWKIENSNLHNLVQKIENLQNEIDNLTQTDELQVKDKLTLQIENSNFHNLVQGIENLQSDIDDLIQTDELQVKDKLTLQIENSNFHNLVQSIENLQSDIGELTPTDKLQLKDKLTLQKDLLFIEKDKFNAQNAIYGTIIQGVGTIIQIVGGIFFFVTAYFSWRNVKATEQKQIAERFSKAVEQLGSDSDNDKFVQLGGIYALEQIATDSEQYHWIIMEVLTSFIQETSSPNNNEGENQSSILTPIQAAITVIGRRNFSQDPKDKKLDLSNAKLAKTNLKGAYLKGAILQNIDLIKANLENTNMTEADLENAYIGGAYLGEANLSQANLKGAMLSNVNRKPNLHLPVKKVDFSQAFLEKADLTNAILTGTNFSQADLINAHLNSAYLDGANFTEAKLMNADLSSADLSNAKFNKANLDQAKLSSQTNLYKTDFSGAKGLKVDRVKAAKNWELAIYDEHFRQDLGLSPRNQD
ncbi:MAG: pentapeptide repeat-containing protein [Okeania sp. SIO3C4]|nr:pentapeptide repeat-containing protein [Okeania sp. SIO3C4]